MRNVFRYIPLLIIALILITAPDVSRAADRHPIAIPPSDNNPVRDVVVDKDGNIYISAFKWNVDRPYLKAYTSDGEPRADFRLMLPNFCCEPFPLKLVYGDDDYLYILLPSSEGLFGEADLQIVRVDSGGMQDSSFGKDGILTLPHRFRLRDFDVSSDGKIWILNDTLELFTFDDTFEPYRVRELKDIFPEKLMGGRLSRYFGRSLFSLDKERLLLFGLMEISTLSVENSVYHSALELDYNGNLVSHFEWQVPWFSKGKSSVSFFKPTDGKSFIKQRSNIGSVIGFPETIKNEADSSKLVVADWSMEDGFHFFDVRSLPLPKDVYLDYDLSLAYFVRDDQSTMVFFPFNRTQGLVVQKYDKDSNPVKRFTLDVFK